MSFFFFLTIKDDEYQINLKVYQVYKCKKRKYDEIHMEKNLERKRMSYKKCVINEKCILTISLSAQSANLNATNEFEC